MGVILGKSKPLVPRGTKEIRYIGHVEKKAVQMAKDIAKSFGQQTRKQRPKKIIFR